MLHLIAAVDNNGGIGRDNKLLCHLPDDLARFKKLTMGHTLIMGRKTFESLPGILPGRPHYVLTSQEGYGPQDDRVRVFHSIEALEAALQPDEDYFVAGGASLYEAFMNKADSLYITEIEETFQADTFFPEIDTSFWYAVEIGEGLLDENNAYYHRFVHYLRK